MFGVAGDGQESAGPDAAHQEALGVGIAAVLHEASEDLGLPAPMPPAAAAAPAAPSGVGDDFGALWSGWHRSAGDAPPSAFGTLGSTASGGPGGRGGRGG
eukprot:4604287-Pyramimonas_sp.AAC.1